MPMELSFHGAADTVTGSCHLLRAGGLNILVDCGLFQGDPRWEERNYDNFDFDPESIDYLLLTHGHLDHCGRIPLLVKKGFHGTIVCTSATSDIAKIVLMDSARIQEEDFAHWGKILLRRGKKPRPPLYTTLEALDALRYFQEFPEYNQPLPLNGNITVTFRDAGHILGASFIEIETRGGGRIIFSGDLGNRNKPIIRDPSPPESADVIVVESTYADRNHRSFDASVEELYHVISDAYRRGGNVLIPSFAIERAQDLLYVLRHLYDQGRMPSCRVFLDSPMGISVTGIMRRHPECFDEETRRLIENHDDPFSFPGLEFTRESNESKQINFIKNHAIIIAGSGMCTGGRIKHHLKHNIWRKASAVIFVGYQAEGTLGRKIVDGKKKVRIFGETYKVNASVHTIGGFSSHADRDILIDWLNHSIGTDRIFIVHGEDAPRKAFKKELEAGKAAKTVHIPHFGDTFTL